MGPEEGAFEVLSCVVCVWGGCCIVSGGVVEGGGRRNESKLCLVRSVSEAVVV